jgi:penicillin-binding protein A
VARWVRRLSPVTRLTATAILLCAALVSCTHEPPLPRASDRADAFVRAFNVGDAAAMAATFREDLRDEWKPSRLHKVIRRVLRAGQIGRFHMELSGPVPQAADDRLREVKGPSVTHAPYAITYWSDAASEPVRFQGKLAVSFRGGRWSILWTKGILLPGYDRAVAFHAAYHWPRRAAIVDRHSRPIAAGTGTSRHYPFHAVAGASVGHLAPLATAEISDAGAGHFAGDLVGASGLEQGLEDELAGRPSSKLELVDRRGRVLKAFPGARARRSKDVKTTLDMKVQAAAEAGYGGATGGAVVIDPRTGDLLAIVSSSPFDPNNYVGASGVRPFNRALSGLYPPGSSMKVVTASAALDTGKVSSTTRLSGPKEFRGVRNFESESFNSLSFAQALEFSVNTAFAQVALKLGPKRLHHYADLFGFNEAPSLSLDTARSSFPLPADEGDLMWGAVGQAQDLATPLEMATVAATVGNGGKRMDPRITLRTPPSGRRVISRETAATMTQLMELVVRGGTGTAANIAGTTVAGKTGTAEVDVDGVRKNHAWFVCFAPAQHPKVAVAVVVEYGGVGGVVAAPLARNILENVLPLAP